MARGRDIELEQAIQEKLQEERKRDLEVILAAQEVIKKKEQERLHAEMQSCWCGMDHEANKRLTESRVHVTSEPELGEPNSRLFVGGLSFNIPTEKVGEILVGDSSTARC